MNYTQGAVSFQPGGEGDWVTAVPNRPLTSGDNLWTDQGSRAELHIGSTAVRLAAQTSLTLLDLDDTQPSFACRKVASLFGCDISMMAILWKWILPTWLLICNAMASTGLMSTTPGM